MLFNTYEFIFTFLPIALIGFYLLASISRGWALPWIIAVSLFFYAWWRPLNVLLIAPSILINYLAAQLLQRLGSDGNRRRESDAVLILGIAFNVAFLGYFKYTSFIVGAINDVFGAGLTWTHIILPLGLSFITFQKIAFLVDVHAGRIRSVTFSDYCLFVMFFPQLVAGPIVHYREMMPQFHGASCRIDVNNIAVGLTLFFFGLFKKVVFADAIGPHVASIYNQAAMGSATSFLPAWMAAIGFTLQIYFDFSGYSDMALGLARLFGIRLPQNFNSPLRSSSIIDFWSRWHMTLTRFLTGYLYNPLVLTLTRRRFARGRPGFGGRHTTLGAFMVLLAVPTLLTMLVSGLWHGAGYLFILWGLLHGVYLTINHGWRLLAQRLWLDKRRYMRVMEPVGFMLTFVSVVAAMVFFRSPTIWAAVDLLKGMIGLNGVGLPASLYERFGPMAGALHHWGVFPESGSAREFLTLVAWTAALLFVALFCPNTMQIMARYEPALGIRSGRTSDKRTNNGIGWNVSLPWAVGISAITAIGIFFVGGQSEFLYWQF